MRLILIATVVILLAEIQAIPPDVAAQSGHPPRPSSPPPGQGKTGDDPIRIDTNLVMLTATVTDARGRYVARLKRDDFSIYEDGVKQEVSNFNTGDRLLVSIGILFDTSGSMVDKIDGVRDAIEHFVKSVAPGDEIFLVRFSDEVEVVQDFTDDRRRILRAVEQLEPQGSTALYDAILAGLQHVAEGKHRKRALMLVTDGNDTASNVSFEAVLALARKSEVIVYGLGIGHGERGSFGHLDDLLGRQLKDEVDMKVLNAIAEATGGRAFFLENAHQGGRDEIDEATTQVADELKQQYTLGYYPSNTRKDGAWRQIKVELSNPSWRVHAKRGYFAQRNNETP